MPKIRRLLACLILSISGSVSSFAQTAYPLEARLDSFYQKTPFEKVHLHLDNSSYNSGESIWFKAYITDGYMLPTTLSGILYVDLIGRDLHIVRSVMLPSMAGVAQGNILTDSLSAGEYELRAYTKWIRNFGGSHFFKKKITIGNAGGGELSQDKFGSLPSSSGQDKAVLQFFPEGGTLVEGIRSKVAFKASSAKRPAGGCPRVCDRCQGEQGGRV